MRHHLFGTDFCMNQITPVGKQPLLYLYILKVFIYRNTKITFYSKIFCELDQFSFVDHKFNNFHRFLEQLMFDKDECKVFITLDLYFSFFLGGTYQCQESYLSQIDIISLRETCFITH